MINKGSTWGFLFAQGCLEMGSFIRLTGSSFLLGQKYGSMKYPPMSEGSMEPARLADWAADSKVNIVGERILVRI